jgi:LacI family transcriptional regulator
LQAESRESSLGHNFQKELYESAYIFKNMSLHSNGDNPVAAAGKQATINEVARAAGVSIATVSRVLNNDPKVKPETRNLVLAAATSLNYRPSLAARSNGGARSFWVCLLHQNPGVHYVHLMQEGATRACTQIGRMLATHACQSVGPGLLDEVTGILDTLRPSGVLLASPLGQSLPLCQALRERSVPHVLLGESAADRLSPSVGFDEREAARQMTQMLLAAGHRRIAFIPGLPDYAADPRHDGFVAAMTEAGLSVPRQKPPTGHFSFHQAQALARRLLEQPAGRRPTAIFAAGDDMAAGALRAAHDLGLSVPGDLSVAGCDDTYIAEITSPRLATIHAPLQEMGAEAINMLVAQEHLKALPDTPEHLRHLMPERSPVQLVLPFSLVNAGSIGAPTAGH